MEIFKSGMNKETKEMQYQLRDRHGREYEYGEWVKHSNLVERGEKTTTCRPRLQRSYRVSGETSLEKRTGNEHPQWHHNRAAALLLSWHESEDDLRVKPEVRATPVWVSID